MEHKSTNGSLQLVKNEEKYYEFIRLLRTDQRVAHQFIKNEPISVEQQKEYMKRYKDNFFVCLYRDSPVGYIGQIDGDIRVAVYPDHFMRGIGAFMVNELMRIHPECFAKVKIDNEASLKLFEKCGFTKKYYILEKI